MKKLVVANWKSHKSREDVERWMDEFEQKITGVVLHDAEVVIAPPLPSVMFVSNRLLKKDVFPDIFLGVQDISSFPAGSYTGAVSARNLEGFGVRYAIVGHSERRRYFGEAHQDVANKVERCVEAGITPILCVDDEYIADQARAINKEYLEKCVVAYEELGAIGTGHNESVDHVKEVVIRIKKVFGEIRVLYGGSVTPENCSQYYQVCDGVLVGGASLDVKKFTSIVKSA